MNSADVIIRIRIETSGVPDALRILFCYIYIVFVTKPEFLLIPEDFEETVEDGSEGKIQLWVVDKNGSEIEVRGEVSADLIWGTKYKVSISGNADTGYIISQ